ncbi:hypothetical protein CkaCkLH20_08781 [Colletotrichum karsti]|uniref:Uncharacterized protein n=1 Tax=Colletotrichum karsti TaxID=1095194 RepID=A0A9P6I2C6_9PEZI|nr:uncharacterized protein CkaCkLH20_08781 [Colletotrichum karsti]KAF9873671.1 hypothetical protein CkaCkLH20_08781 [Colletotrichum karsti]
MNQGPKTPIPGLGLLPTSQTPNGAVIDTSQSPSPHQDLRRKAADWVKNEQEDHDAFDSSIYDDEDSWTKDDQADNDDTVTGSGLQQPVNNTTNHVADIRDLRRRLTRLETKLNETDVGQNVANQRALEAQTRNLAMGRSIDALGDGCQIRDAEQKEEIKALKAVILGINRRLDYQQSSQESYRQCFVTHDQVDNRLKESTARFEDRTEAIEGHMGEMEGHMGKMQGHINQSPSRGDIRSDLVIFFVAIALLLVVILTVFM